MPAALRVLLAGVLFATGGALIKSCGMPALERSGLRALFAAATLFALVPESRRRPTPAVLRLVPAYFAATCFFVVANTMTTAAHTIFLQSTSPLWVVVLGRLFHERAHRRDLLMLCGIAAGMTLCFVAPHRVLDTASDPPLGNLLALTAGFGFAWLLLAVRRMARSDPHAGAVVVAWGNVLTFPLSFALMPFVGESPTLGTATDWTVLVTLGVFQVGLAYALLMRAMPHVAAVRASLLLMVEPALNPLIAWLAHGEHPHWLALVGGATIVGSVVAGLLLHRRRR